MIFVSLVGSMLYRLLPKSKRQLEDETALQQDKEKGVSPDQPVSSSQQDKETE